MTFHPFDPSKDATFQVTLGSSFDEVPKQTLHGLKYNFKPAAIDYSQPGTLTQAEDGAGEVSLVVASTAEGEHHVFRGPLQGTKSNEFILVYDPETNSFVLDRVSSMSRLSATRGSRTNTLNGASGPAPSVVDRPSESTPKNRSKSNDDIPRISLDPSSNKDNVIDIDSLDEEEEGEEQPVAPTLATPRLPPASPVHARAPSSSSRKQEIVSSDEDSEIDIGPPSNPLGPTTAAPAPAAVDADDDVSDEDLDDLANELESSLENRPGSSSDDVDDSDGPPRGKAPDFGNVPRSGGPISMSRFARGRRRQEEEESSSDDDDDD